MLTELINTNIDFIWMIFSDFTYDMTRGRMVCMLLLILISERCALECHFYQDFTNLNIGGIVVAEYGLNNLGAVDGIDDLVKNCSIRR